ncbi:DNA-binding protein [Oceanidesulfovibrio indonesiensis]|uniref:DNA-binding protein n=1 Tax=Oceanidesulfovibrio indonesiensis TaxID=54767 RepID=A0A7M3MDU0_9BACT|nr:CLJU_RS11820 family redox protein [Oceanidesulfovibrio indonesiensis]TVM16337.1 DNA-binding protein [Oceanidesulfovibrio indonesiensis]
MQRFPEIIARYEGWTCQQCGKPLMPGKAQLTYMGSVFDVELPKCAKCGMVIVPEELALGKMLEVEQVLEDK